MSARQRNPVQRSLNIIRLMLSTPQPERGLREIARSLEMPASTTHRLLQLLEEEHMVEKASPDGGYRLGLEFFRLAWLGASLQPLRRIGLPIMKRLTEACNETSLLAEYDPSRQEMMFVASVESNHPLKYFVSLYEWLPIHAGASGLAILAFLPDSEREVIVKGIKRSSAITPATITDRSELVREIERIRAKGYAFTRGQRIVGAVGIAAPIWGLDETVAGCACVTIPTHRFDPKSRSKLAGLVKEAASQVSLRLASPLSRDGKQL